MNQNYRNSRQIGFGNKEKTENNTRTILTALVISFGLHHTRHP